MRLDADSYLLERSRMEGHRLTALQGHPSQAANSSRSAVIALFIAATFHFYQYVLRSAPSVMMPELSHGFGLSTLRVASIVGFFYYGYAPFSLVAGVAMDRLGPRKVLPFSAVVAGVGALLFGIGGSEAGSIGRLLQGAGGVFAPVGAIYIATKYFPSNKVASLIGAIQMFGMAGGAAGQFAVGPLISKGTSCNSIWLGMCIAGIGVGVLLLFLLPPESRRRHAGLRNTVSGLYSVFKNRQSILCGLISGLLFIPTTIFGMIWAVRFLQEAHGFEYGPAVMRSATISLGWIIGCPLLGSISDRLGRRKPVIIGGAVVLCGCLAWILFGPPNVLPPYVLGLIAGLASGAAMLPYTVIKEANPPQWSGMATGVLTFLNFTISALMAPIFSWILQHVSGGKRIGLGHYQQTFALLLVGVAISIVLTFYLEETGPRATVVDSDLTQAA